MLSLLLRLIAIFLHILPLLRPLNPFSDSRNQKKCRNWKTGRPRQTTQAAGKWPRLPPISCYVTACRFIFVGLSLAVARPFALPILFHVFFFFFSLIKLIFALCCCWSQKSIYKNMTFLFFFFHFASAFPSPLLPPLSPRHLVRMKTDRYGTSRARVIHLTSGWRFPNPFYNFLFLFSSSLFLVFLLLLLLCLVQVSMSVPNNGAEPRRWACPTQRRHQTEIKTPLD